MNDEKNITLSDNIINGDGKLQLSPIVVNSKYLSEWNENMTDFIVLTKDGKLIDNSIYRIGGMSGDKDIENDYFMLIKYVECYYSPDIIRMSNSDSNKYLSGRWCIFDKNGILKKEFDEHISPYIVHDSCIYSINSKYYNIETDELYCNASKIVESSKYLFLENAYDKDLIKRGVMKINKKDGTCELL